MKLFLLIVIHVINTQTYQRPGIIYYKIILPPIFIFLDYETLPSEEPDLGLEFNYL